MLSWLAMGSMSVVAFICGAIAVLGLPTVAQDVPYALSAWSCGVIVWPNELPDYADNFAQQLSEAAEAAFGFWGYPLPATAEEPHDEASAIRIYNPTTETEMVISPLTWNDRVIQPVVVFAFPDEAAMRSALGETRLFGAMWCPLPIGQAFPHTDPWIAEAGNDRRNLLCPSWASDSALIHECAHWFTYEWCSARRIDPYRIPDYIVEGIAEATSSVVEDHNTAVYDHLRALAWAKDNCLPVADMGSVMMYAVGESLVNYLVDTVGIDSFLSTLSRWAMEPWNMIDLVETGWRISLVLAGDCPFDTVRN